jgi:hypothetical protein
MSLSGRGNESEGGAPELDQEREELIALAAAALQAGTSALRGWYRAEPNAEGIRRLRRDLGAIAMVVASLSENTKSAGGSQC